MLFPALYRITRFTSSPLLRLDILSRTRIHTSGYIYPSLLNRFHFISYYPRINFLKPSKLNCNSIMACNYSSENKSNNLDKSSKTSDSDTSDPPTTSKVSQRTRLKQAVRDYGATIVVFHITISLASLGICYAAISNGLDAVALLTYLGFPESLISSKVAVGGSTFVIAYAVHKVFAPVRIGITLSLAPFLVRYLRRINFLKPPKKMD